jgi:4-amino-4-deoxy-L-arabinose transferase-like glycosyltransferase
MAPGLARALLLTASVRVMLVVAVYGCVGHRDAFLTADSAVYLDLARSIGQGAYEIDGVPHLRRPPGYPVLLAPGAALGQPIAFALALQILLGVVTTHLVYASAARLFNERAGSRAALLCAVEPVMLVWMATIMPETLFTCLIAGMVYALICYRDRPAFLPAAAAAVLSAGAALTKPIAFALPLLASAIVLSLATLPWRSRLSKAVLVLCLGYAPMAAWTTRNISVAGSASFSTQIDGVLALSAPAAVVAARDGRPFSEVRSERGTHDTLGVGDLRVVRADGVETLLSSPVEYASIHFSGVARTLLNPGVLPYLVLFQHVPATGPDAPGQTVLDYGAWAGFWRAIEERGVLLWTAVVLTLITLAYLVLGVWGAVLMGRSGWFLTSVALYVLVLAGGPWGQSRFRHPAMPVLCIFAGRALKLPGRPGRSPV